MLCLILGACSVSYAQVQWMRNGLKGASAVASQVNISAVPDGQGGVFFAYENDPQGDDDIYIQYVNAAGVPQWGSNGIVIATAAGNQKRPHAVSDGAGGVYVVWEDEVSEDIYMQRLDAQGNELWTQGGLRICSAAGRQTRVRAVPNGSGGVIAAWIDERTGSDTDIYAQNIDVNGNAMWQVNGIAVCVETGNQSSHCIKADGAGGAYVAWQDYRNGYTNIDIYIQHLNSSGLIQLGAQGMAVVTAANNQQKPDIAVEDGSVFISWQDYRSGTNNDIYAQKIDSFGNIQWGTNGYPVCTSGGHQTNSRLTGDGTGGAVIVWDDNRTGYDIYAQKISAGGLAQWDANGLAVNESDGYQYTAQVTGDGAGGALAVWNDDRSSPSDPDLMCQHIRSDGTLLFAAEGLAVVDTAGYQDGHAAVNDGSGGFITLWRDARDGSSDIYIQHINDALQMTEPAAGVLWAGDRPHTVSWSVKPQSVLFDHYVLTLSTESGDGFPESVADDISPDAVSVQWTPQTVSSENARLRLDGVTAGGTVLASAVTGVFSVDSEPPSPFHLTGPADNTNTTLDVTFSWEQAADAMSGLDHYELWLNDGLYTDTLHSESVTLTLAEGVYTWTVKAVDSAGVARTAYETWNLSTSRDNDPPTIFHLQTPVHNAWTAHETPRFEWSGAADAGSGLMKYMFYVDGSLAEDNIPPTRHYVTTCAPGLGTHTWYVVAVDSVGNSTESEEIHTVHIDYVAPEPFSITGPANDVWINTATPEFSWSTARDTGSGLKELQLWVDGELFIGSINPQGQSLVPGSSYALTEGAHQWYMKAVDNVGNSRQSTQTYDLYIDVSKPDMFLLVRPQHNSIVTTNRPEFQWNAAEDAVSSIAYYKVYLDMQLIADQHTGISYVPDTGIPEGEHEWKVRAYDMAGNSKNSSSFTFILDVSPPSSFSLISPQSSETLHTQRPEFSWTRSSDSVSGFASYTFVVEGVETIENIAEQDTAVQLDHVFENGTYAWYVTAVDSAGHTFETPRSSFTIDCNPPALLSQASVSATEDEPFTYTLAASDPDEDDVETTVTAFPAWLHRSGMVFTGTPVETTQDTVITCTLSDGIYTVDETVVINVIHVNDPPVFTSAEGAQAVEHQPFTYTAAATDIENDELIFTFTVLPSWLTASGASVSGTPGEGATDTLFIAIVSDGTDTDTLRVDVSVQPVNDKPVITSPAAAEAVEGELFRYRAVAEDPDSKQVTVKYAGLPGWLNISGPEVRGTPGNNAADTSFTVIAFDGELSDTLAVSVTVIPVNSAPVFETELGTWEFFDVDTLTWAVQLNEYASDPDDPDASLSWSYELPDTNNVSVSIDQETSIAEITAVKTQGTCRIVFHVTDPHGASDQSTLTLQIIITHVENGIAAVPETFKLYNNYPNPFNASTTIRYDVPLPAHVSIVVYNTIGRKVEELVQGMQQPGSYSLQWDSGQNPTGIYFVMMQSASYREVRRIVLLK